MADGKENVVVAVRTDLGAPAAGARGAGQDAVARAMRRRGEESRFWWLVPTIYIIFLMLPIYWLVNMSFKTNQEILGAFSLWPQNPTLQQLRGHLHRPVLVQGLHQLDHLRGHEHGDLDRRGAAGGLRLLALPLPRRQAPVLLAAHQPHGAAGGVRAALLPALFGLRADRHAYRGGARALPVQRAAGGVDPRRLHVRRAEGDRRDRLYRRLFLPALLREDIHAADRVAASASPPSSASCSPGSSC